MNDSADASTRQVARCPQSALVFRADRHVREPAELGRLLAEVRKEIARVGEPHHREDQRHVSSARAECHLREELVHERISALVIWNSQSRTAAGSLNPAAA